MFIYIYLRYILSLIILLFGVNGNLPSKLYGGTRVSNFYYSHQASIQYQNEHICGGTIISHNSILTSASCITSDRYVYYANVQVLIATNDLMDLTSLFQPHFQVSYIILHEDYDPSRYWINDIAILKTTSSMIISFPHRARMPSTTYTSNVFLLGWGKNLQTETTRFLQKIDVKALTPHSCERQYNVMLVYSSTQYCLLPRSPTSQITQGDSGSPAMRAQTIVGIISLLSTIPNHPTIYTNVHSYVTWIDDYKNKYSN